MAKVLREQSPEPGKAWGKGRVGDEEKVHIYGSRTSGRWIEIIGKWTVGIEMLFGSILKVHGKWRYDLVGCSTVFGCLLGRLRRVCQVFENKHPKLVKD